MASSTIDNRATAHLPNGSEELAATADLEVVVEGVPLKLHSAVLASGSRVLCNALSAHDAALTDNAASRSAAVQRAFEGFDLAAVQPFLKLLYDPFSLEEDAPAVGTSPDAYWQNLLALADKLDAPSVIKACGSYISPKLSTSYSEWVDWLVLADGAQMRKVVAQCMKPAIKVLLSKSVLGTKSLLPALGALSLPTMQLMCEVLVVAGKRYSQHHVVPYLPDNVSEWSKPGDLL